MAYLNGNNVLLAETNIKYGVGETTPEGGEIFNTYAYNKAGKNAHAQNSRCEATGENSHAGGLSSKSTAPRAFTHGWACEGNANNTVAMGGKVIMNHDSATGLGYYLTSSRKFQANFGQFNAPNSKAILVVGNGTSDTDRSNVFEVTETGSLVLNGVTITSEQLQKLLDLIS